MVFTSLGLDVELMAAMRQAGGVAATCAATANRAKAVLSLANMVTGLRGIRMSFVRNRRLFWVARTEERLAGLGYFSQEGLCLKEGER